MLPCPTSSQWMLGSDHHWLASHLMSEYFPTRLAVNKANTPRREEPTTAIDCTFAYPTYDLLRREKP
jgi:hypothetical protein